MSAGIADLHLGLVILPDRPKRELVRRKIIPDVTVAEAREQWLKDQGFTADPYSENFIQDVPGTTLGINIGRSEGVINMLRAHDLHHIALGYSTDLPGEMEITAWEAAAKGTFLSRLVGTFVAIGGLLVAPVRVAKAYVDGWGKQSLYGNPAAASAMLGATVGQLRGYMGVPLDGMKRP